MMYVVRLSLVIHNNMFSITHSQCSPLSPPPGRECAETKPQCSPVARVELTAGPSVHIPPALHI